MIICDSTGIPMHIQKLTIWHDKVLFTLSTGNRYWRKLASLDPDYITTRESAINPLDYLAMISTLLESYIDSELGLFYQGYDNETS